MKSLKETVEGQALSNQAFARKSRISFRAICDIRSGKTDEALLDKNNPGNSKKKKLGLIQTVVKALIACNENPQEWFKSSGISLDKQEEHAVLVATTDQTKPLTVPGLGSEEWGTLLLIAHNPLTKEDAEQLFEAQKVLGEFFTVKLAIQLLISKHRKFIEKE